MKEQRFLVLSVWIIPCSLAIACGDGNRPKDVYSMRDSAGVQIAENAAPSEVSEGSWVVSSEPVLQIGALEGPEEYTFDRIGSVLGLSDGQVLVANLRTNELRYYGLDGLFRKTVGGTGEGPGEFMMIYKVWLGTAGTLWVNDARLGRLTMLGPDGEFVKSIRIQGNPELGFPAAFGSTSGGGFWVTSGTGGFGRGAEGLLEPSTLFFSRYDSVGSFDGVVADFQNSPQWAHTSGGVTSANSIPYSVGWTVYAGTPSHLFLGTGVDPQVEVRAEDGRLERLIRWDAAPRPIESPEIERFKEDFMAEYEGSDREEFWNGWLRDVPFPDFMPTYDKLLVDRLGHLWVREYQPSWEDSRTWFTFAPDGKGLGEVALPPNLVVTEIGEDYLLGTWRDELDVEYVRMYSLDRGG